MKKCCWMKSTTRNLELFETTDGMNKKDSLLHLLDKCKTAMGSRKLRRWLSSPLTKKEAIERRLDAVQTLINQAGPAERIRNIFSGIGDLERIIARISLPNTAVADVVKLRESIEPLAVLNEIFKQLENQALKTFLDGFDPLEDLYRLLETYILPNPSFKLKEGGFIRPNVDEKLDKLVDLMKNGKQLIANMETKEKTKTEITSLKIRFNKVFGYYIEVSNASKHLVPDHYIRKQTLVNNERYVTEELKELEESILTAEDEARTLELEIYSTVKKQLQSQIRRIQTTARIIANIDVLSSFAHSAKMNNYIRPELDDNPDQRSIFIENGRHPVIESLDFDRTLHPK